MGGITNESDPLQLHPPPTPPVKGGEFSLPSEPEMECLFFIWFPCGAWEPDETTTIGRFDLPLATPGTSGKDCCFLDAA